MSLRTKLSHLGEEELIRLGTEKPELRSQIRPLLKVAYGLTSIATNYAGQNYDDDHWSVSLEVQADPATGGLFLAIVSTSSNGINPTQTKNTSMSIGTVWKPHLMAVRQVMAKHNPKWRMATKFSVLWNQIKGPPAKLGDLIAQYAKGANAAPTKADDNWYVKIQKQIQTELDRAGEDLLQDTLAFLLKNRGR